MDKLKSILLIDDDNINNFIVINKLNKLKLVERVISVENGEEALTYLKKCIDENPEFLPELIFLDINMPIMDGWDFLEHFEKFDIQVKDRIHIYMVSSSVYKEDIIRSKEYESVKKFISKPLVRETIEEIIRLRMTTP